MRTTRVLNRTLLKRQYLLERTSTTSVEMVEHLVGLQAQDTQPPYVGLWSRLDRFDPADLSGLLESRAASRILLMRGTIHLVTAADCLGLRPPLQDMLERQMRGTEFFGHCADIPREELESAAYEVLGTEPVPVRELGTGLAKRFPAHRPGHLANTVRVLLPLVQAPPRGVWKRSGGPAYVHAEEWHGAPYVASLATTPVGVLATLSTGDHYELWHTGDGRDWQRVDVPLEAQTAGDAPNRYRTSQP